MSQIKVGMMRHCGLVKPVSVTRVTGRYLIQQKGLPILPVPTLQQTCERYLTALETVVEGDELKRIKEQLEEFQKPGGVGERLQKCLERRAHITGNWYTEAVMEGSWYTAQTPLVVYSHFATLFPKMDFKDKQGQIRCAAKIIAGLLDIKTMIDNDTLPVEYMKGKPICMDQYNKVLSSCCVPGLERVLLVYHGNSSSPPKHITVVHNSQFFVLDVYNSDGTPLTVDQLCVQLERICNASLQTNMEPVGILTTLNRNSRYKSYVNFIKDDLNKESLSAIERSISVVCLDGPMPKVSDEMYTINAASQMLHGGGSQWNSGNRWFEKPMQFIIGEDGACGGNFSHSQADGIVTMAFNDHVVAHMKKPEMMQSSIGPLPMPRKLHFNVTPEIKRDIEEAKQSMDLLAQDLDLRLMVFDHFGKNVLKAHKVSPDAFVQMAIQLAYYRMYQKCPAAVEPVTLRIFKHGRTSTVCATSSASATFVKAFDDPGKQNTEKIDLFVEAIKVHKSLSIIAMDGQHIEDHLFALKAQAVEQKIPMPDIFTDASFSKLFHYNLSTSQVTSRVGNLPIGCIDAPDGYDIIYSIMNDHMKLVLTVYKTSKETNAVHMIRALEDALLDMRTMLQQTPRV
ncbi:hypothetical protein PAMP_013737 [Pampus punctatissimus]